MLNILFSFRFSEIFAYPDEVEEMQVELNELIQDGVTQITTLLKNAENMNTYNQGTCTNHFLLNG